MPYQALLSLAFVAIKLAQAAQYEQCKDPLFQTHWAGKNDIPTLTPFPAVNTNLNQCLAFNERASCCQQGFESEQTKYFEFWRTILQGKFWRVYAHRSSVLAASAGFLRNGTASKVDLEQLEVVKQRFQDVLSPAVQAPCLTGILTYVAGMMCFSCKPEWFQYAVLASKKMTADRVLRIRMSTSVCVELWAACSSFGTSIANLRAALRDSRLARTASQAEENFDMFLSQLQLCNWAHDTIALHPFKQPSREEQILATQVPPATAPAVQRRLSTKRYLDVMADGRATGFPRQWQGVQMISKVTKESAGFALGVVFLHLLDLRAAIW